MTGSVWRRVYRARALLVKPAALAVLLLLGSMGNPPALPAQTPDSESLLLRLGERLREGDPDAVLAALDSLDSGSLDSRMWNLRGLALATKGSHPEAVRAYEEGIRRDHGRSELHLNLAVSLLELGATGRALAEFETAARLEPRSLEARLGLARGLLRFGRLERTGEELRGALDLAPEDPRVHRALADWADACHDGEQSLHWWTGLESRWPTADSARRLAELSQQEPAQAIAHYRDCLERDPCAQDCAEALGSLLLASGRAEEALEPLRRAVDGGHGSSPAVRNLLLALQRLGRTEELEALVAEHPPSEGAAWGIVALARREAGQGEGALEAVEEGVRLSPQDADLFNLQGVILEERGRREDARAAWERALALRPGHPQAETNLRAHPPR